VLKEIIQTNAKSAWLITPNAADDLLQRWGSVLTDPMKAAELATKVPEPSAKDDAIVLSAQALSAIANLGMFAGSLVGPYQLKYGQVPKGSILVLPVEGVLMKYDSCGYYGTETLADRMLTARDNPNIVGIILEIDTPGGNVAGVRTFVDAINQTRKTKPVVSWINDGMCASGGYWIASQTDEIISSHDTNLVGSIGVMIQLRNNKKYMESMGIEDLVIYADGSEEKNSEVRDAIDGKPDALKTKMLNPIREQFVKAVTSGRQGKLQRKPEDPLKGGIFGDKSTKTLGLVDSFGNLEAAISSVNRIAKTRNSNPSYNQPQNEMKQKLTVGKHDSLITALGLKPAEGQTEFEVDASDMMAAIMKQNSDGITALTDSLKALTDGLKASSDATTANAEALKAIQDDVKTLGESSGIPLKPKAESPDSPGGKDKRPEGRLFANRP
jgi:signal peptide peptidase SppA